MYNLARRHHPHLQKVSRDWLRDPRGGFSSSLKCKRAGFWFWSWWHLEMILQLTDRSSDWLPVNGLRKIDWFISNRSLLDSFICRWDIETVFHHHLLCHHHHHHHDAQVLKVLHELHTAMKTHHTYQSEFRQAESKLAVSSHPSI